MSIFSFFFFESKHFILDNLPIQYHNSVISKAAPDEYFIRTCPLLLQVKLYSEACYNTPLSCVVCITVPLQKRKITCSPIFNDEIARARPNMNIKGIAYVKG